MCCSAASTRQCERCVPLLLCCSVLFGAAVLCCDILCASVGWLISDQDEVSLVPFENATMILYDAHYFINCVASLYLSLSLCVLQVRWYNDAYVFSFQDRRWALIPQKPNAQVSV